MNFVIIDDDKSIRTIISMLIRQGELGNVIAQLESGENAVEDVMFYHPDILIVDLLLPGKDGVQIVTELISRGFKGKIIMISCVEDEEMVSKAYEAGVMFYIYKPINAIETTTVLTNVKRMVELEESMYKIRNVLFETETQQAPKESSVNHNLKNKIDKVFSDIGLIGLSGTDEIREVLLEIYRIQKMEHHKAYRLKDIYAKIIKDKYGEEGADINQKNMEQRIRRAIQKALANLAEIGCEDYYDPVFTRYANILFDFKQVRQEMAHIKDPETYSGKVNTKKFMEGILTKIDK